MFAQAYLHTAISILNDYKGESPFSAYLKKFFSSNKKFGSRDRNHIANLCYCYFRLGKWNANITIEEKIKLALFLCSQQSSLLTEKLLPELNKLISADIEEKINHAEKFFSFNRIEIFPWKNELGDEIEFEEFSKSFLLQPDLFIRIRPGKKNTVEKKLVAAQLPFSYISNNCFSFPNTSKVDKVLEIDKNALIQDFNSQQTLNLLFNSISEKNKKIEAWDCCAASGGKSILLYDLFEKVDITVSDVRENILFNLRKRFGNAGIKNFISFVADVGADNFSINKKFDVVICDVPCSGSGTWSRTPEQLCFFEEEKIIYYDDLQKKIAINAAKAVKEKGYFVYITCSVFKKENEDVVEYLQKNSSLSLQSMQYLKGYNERADTLFTALFTL